MDHQAPHIIPSIYLANYLGQFEPLMQRYGAQRKSFSKGEYLTQHGVINNTMSSGSNMG